jgi:hypothetical protein
MKKAFLSWCAQSLIACREHLTMWFEMEQEFMDQIAGPQDEVEGDGCHFGYCKKVMTGAKCRPRELQVGLHMH